MIPGLQLIERDITNHIKGELDKIGLLYRIFSRSKTRESFEEKIKRKDAIGEGYNVDKKLLQDIIGIRIVTYFKDDIDLIIAILRDTLTYKSEEIDNHKLTVFKPKRTNIICDFFNDHISTFKGIQNSNQSLNIVDATFELQLRTVLSEGWHEIDHALRYKAKSDWDNHEESERLLNGIYASLETNDIALKNLFNELSYKHFKNKNWQGLIRTKFRLHFKIKPLNDKIIELLNNNNDLAKELIRLNRHDVLLKIYKSKLHLPVTMDNLFYLLNILIIKNDDALSITPEIITTLHTTLYKRNAGLNT